MTTAHVRPPFDAEPAAVLPAVNEVLPSSIQPDDLKRVREQVAATFLPIDEVIAGRAIERAGFHGFDPPAPDSPLALQARAARADRLRRIARFGDRSV